LVGAGAVAGGAWFALRSSDAASGPRAMLKLLPADTTAALIVPDGAKALGGLKALKDRFQGKIKAIEPLIGEGSRLVGFDLNKPETMAEIGLRPGGGFATAAGVDWAALVFAVEDEAKFERFVKKRFEAETGGELAWKSIDREGVSVRMARTGGADGTDVFGLTYLRGHAIVAPTRNWEGETVDPAGSLLKVSRTTEETSLASRADLMGPLEEVGYDLGAILLTDLAKGAEIGAGVADDRQRPRDAEALRRAGKQVQGLAVGIGVDSRGLRLLFAMSGPPEAVKALQAAFKPSAAGPDYAKVAPPDGLLLLSVAFNPTGIMPWLREQLMDYERKVIDKTLAASTELTSGSSSRISTWPPSASACSRISAPRPPSPWRSPGRSPPPPSSG